MRLKLDFVAAFRTQFLIRFNLLLSTPIKSEDNVLLSISKDSATFKSGWSGSQSESDDVESEWDWPWSGEYGFLFSHMLFGTSDSGFAAGDSIPLSFEFSSSRSALKSGFLSIIISSMVLVMLYHRSFSYKKEKNITCKSCHVIDQEGTLRKGVSMLWH